MAVNNGRCFPTAAPVTAEHAMAESDADSRQGAVTLPEEGDAPGGRSSAGVFNPYYTGRPRTPAAGIKTNAIDRQEIIRRVKAASRPASPELDRRKSPVLCAPGQGSEVIRAASPDRSQSHAALGIQIERPRSALHRGDFRQKADAEVAVGQFTAVPERTESASILATSPVAPWHPAFPLNSIQRAGVQPSGGYAPDTSSQVLHQRARAASQASLASSFVYKPPTSPLVHSSRPDTPDQSLRDRSRSPDKNRRHTFSPPMLHKFATVGDSLSPRLYGDGFGHRSERQFHYQAHQPARYAKVSSSLPQTPLLGMRRPSLSDSPLHHAPMVGSYEESILRGRMSTTPSKPLNFLAQIGVLGMGNCKASLRCPPHVSIPFPAVYYSYDSGNRQNPVSDQPSPYVGHIDLENTLKPAETSDRRRQRINAARTPDRSRASSRTREGLHEAELLAQQRQRQKQKRRAGSPRSPPGGCYRIPQTGQLQIVIKNPNKTAVKLFLVPYDLSDMEPGHKTFIRQRSYSAGPIIDMPLSSRKNLGTDRPEAAINQSGDVRDKPMLRYLIHLNICCPSRGRYYLYKSIRVVFANRVPDGKEKLRNEIQMSEPRFTPYKPERSASSTQHIIRRQSISDQSPGAEDAHWTRLSRKLAQSLPTVDNTTPHGMPFQPLPQTFSILPTLESRPASRQMGDDIMDLDTAEPIHWHRPIYSPAVQELVSQVHGLSQTRKTPEPTADPFDFERGKGRGRTVVGGRSESLLSRRLMDLAFQQDARNNAEGSEHGTGQ